MISSISTGTPTGDVLRDDYARKVIIKLRTDLAALREEMAVSNHTVKFVAEVMHIMAKEKEQLQADVQNLRLMQEVHKGGGKLAMPPSVLSKEVGQWQNASERTFMRSMDMLGLANQAQQHLNCRIQDMRTTLDTARATLLQSPTQVCSPQPERMPLPCGLGCHNRKDNGVEHSPMCLTNLSGPHTYSIAPDFQNAAHFRFSLDDQGNAVLRL